MNSNLQPNSTDLRVVSQAGNITRAVAVSGPHLGKRFVRTGSGMWLRAGDATEEELGLSGKLNQIFDSFKRKGGAA